MEEKILLTLNSNMEIQRLHYVFFSRNTFCYNLFFIKNDFVSNVLTTINTFTRWARQTTLYTKRADSYEPALYELYR